MTGTAGAYSARLDHRVVVRAAGCSAATAHFEMPDPERRCRNAFEEEEEPLTPNTATD